MSNEAIKQFDDRRTSYMMRSKRKEGGRWEEEDSTYRRLIAGSNCQGIFVAPRTSTPVSSFPTPLICCQRIA